MKKINPTNLRLLGVLRINKHVMPTYTDDGKPSTLIRYTAYNTETEKIIGYADLNPKNHSIENVSIDRSYRRQGVAMYLYDYIENDIKNNLYPSSEDLPDGASKFWKHRARTKLVRRLATKKNPVPYSDENVRRWAIVNIPKIIKESTIYFDSYTLNKKISGFFITYFMLSSQRFVGAKYTLIIYTKLWNYLLVAPISKLDRIKYWKYYTKTKELARFAGTHAEKLYKNYFDQKEADVIWINWLKEHFEN